MKTSNLLRRFATLMLILALVPGLSTSAKRLDGSATTQSQKPAPAQTDAELLKLLDKALIEVEYLRSVRKLSDEEKAALNQKIAALEDLLKLERQRAEAYKSANDERASANTLDEKRIAVYEAMLADYKQERARLMAERDRARRNGKLYAAGAFVFGLAVAIFARGNN